MNYHLSRNGQASGVFPLEELRRRLAAGELSPSDLVWCEGMLGWQTLSSVLQAKGYSNTPGGPPTIGSVSEKPKSRKLWVWIIGAAALFLMLLFTLAGFVVYRFYRVMAQVSQDATASTTSSVDVASKQIVTGTNSITEAGVRRRSHDFRIRQYVDGYRKNGRHDQPCDVEAMEFLNAWIELNYGNGTNAAAIPAKADKLVATSGCDDPLIWTAAASACNELQEKTRRLEKAVAAFPQSHHLAYPQFYASVDLASQLGRKSPRVAELDRQSLRLFKKALSDGSFQPGDEPEIAEILVRGWASGFFQRNGKIVYEMAQQSGSNRWLGLVLEGQYNVDQAWKARGNDTADKVTPKGWELFNEDLAKARALFTEAWKLHPDRPFAPASMIAVAMGETGATDMRLWFDRAIAAQVDYPQAWVQMRWGLRPRWHGSQEAMLALGMNAVDTRRFDTDVPRKFFDVLKDLEAELEVAPGEHIYGREDIWPYLEKMYQGYIAAPSEKAGRDGWRSTYAAVAYLAGKNDIARKQLELVDWKPRRSNLTAWGTDLSLMPLKVAAVTGPSGPRVTRAEEKAARMDFAGAIQLFEEINSAADTDQRTRDFCVARLAALKQEQRLAKGEWVDFLPDGENDANWVMDETKLKKLPDGAVEVESGNDGHGFYSRTRIGSDFEITGEFEVVRFSNDAFQAGVMIGLPDSFNSAWYAFRMKRNPTEGQGVSFSRGWTTDQVWKPAALNNDRNTFQFRLQRGKADAWINGTQVLKGASIGRDLRLYPDSLVGIGAFHDTNETVIRYRNVKVRRLLPGQ